MIWLIICLSWKITKIRIYPLFFKVDLCSATSMESSRQDLLNDMAEHMPILKYNQNTHYSLIFQDKPMFSNINGKLSPRPFEWYGWTWVYPEKITKIRISPLFFKIGLCSAASIGSSRRDLLNDMAEHRFILKNSQNTYYPRFSTPKTGIAFPKTGVLFLLWIKL